MKKDVWAFLNKEKWTEGGVKHVENIHNAIVGIIEKADIEDLRILKLAIDENLYEVMDILAEYVREEENEGLV